MLSRVKFQCIVACITPYSPHFLISEREKIEDRGLFFHLFTPSFLIDSDMERKSVNNDLLKRSQAVFGLELKMFWVNFLEIFEELLTSFSVSTLGPGFVLYQLVASNCLKTNSWEREWFACFYFLLGNLSEDLLSSVS